MTYLLDTCLISELVAKQPSPGVIDWLDAQPQVALYLSVMTIGELAKGISKLPASNRKRQLTGWLNQDLIALDLKAESSVLMSPQCNCGATSSSDS